MSYFVAPYLVIVFILIHAESHYYIKPQNGSCPHHACLTISQFATNLNWINDSNGTTSLYFLPGNHTLSRELSLTNINNFSMMKFAQKSDYVTIECLSPVGKIVIVDVVVVSIKSLHFIGCGGNRITLVEQMIIEDVSFQGVEGRDRALVITNVATACIVRSSFIHASCIQQNNIGRFLSNQEVLNHVYLEKSTSSSTGGALYTDFSNVSIINSNFSYNRADVGGALFASNSTLNISGSTFNYNSARFGGVIVTSKSTVNIVNSLFNENSGEIFGGVVLSYKDSFNLSGSTLVYNKANMHGGVMKIFNSLVSINDSTFKGNKADQSSGVIYAVNSVFYSSDSTFINNSAALNGGVVITEGESWFKIDNCTFRYNSANFNGGVLVSSDRSFFKIANSAFTSNSAIKDGGVIITFDQSAFTITNSNFNNNAAAYGGAICTFDSSSLTISGSKFTTNSAIEGGVMYTRDDSLLISNYCSFIKNRAVHGGVMSTDERFLLNISVSNFTENSAADDGGVILSNGESSFTITRCAFYNNSAADYAGVFLAFDKSLFNINNSTFAENLAVNRGGVIYASRESSFKITCSTFFKNSAVKYGGVLSATIKSSFYITSSAFTNNSATDGGVMYTLRQPSFNISNCVFTNNSAADNGGVMYTSGTSLYIITDSKFATNSALHDGGVITTREASQFKVIGSTFIYNRANVDGGVVNSQGNSTFDITNTAFANNVADDNGGVLYVSDETSFTIVNSTFTNNIASRYGGVVITLLESSLNITSSTFIANSAVGIGGVVSCLGTTLRINIDSCKFQLNFAGNSGAILYSLNCITLIANSRFEHNFASLYTLNTKLTFSGCTRYTNNVEPLDDTAAQNGLASQLQGGIITTFQSTVVFMGLNSLLKNQAQYGGAILATESKILMYDNTTIAENVATYGSGGGIFLQRSILEVRGNCNISQNRALRGGGIHATSSTVTVYQPGTLQLINNIAKDGGGMCLEINTKLYILKSERSKMRHDYLLSFIGNCAKYGGAVYVPDYTNSGACLFGVECFIQTLALHRSALTKKTTNMYFSENFATEEGSILFGGLLDRCIPSPFAEVYLVNKSPKYSGVSYLLNISNVPLDSIGSSPVRVCFCNSQCEPDCSYQLSAIKVKKGEAFNVSLVAVDQVNHTVQANIIGSLSSSEGGFGEGQQIQAVARNCTDITFNLFSPHDTETIYLSADGPCGSATLSTSRVTIQFLDCTCPIGFEPLSINQSPTRCECICDFKLSLYIADCNSETGYLYRVNTNSWITYINDSDLPGYIIHTNCPFNYCLPPTKNVSINLNVPDGADGQCANNRAGVLCGACEVNHSLSLGSDYCLSCPSHWPAVLIIIISVSMLVGIVLVAVLLALNITVTVGLINSFILYANLVSPSSAVFFPPSKFNFPAIFISWLNLEIGVDVCFYDGLDAYTKTWIQLAFPAYIITLVVVIIKVSEHSPKFTRLIGRRDPIATLATLVLLSYAKLLSTTITALSPVTLHYPNGSKDIVWLADGNVKYLQGKHIPLFLVALLIILIGLPYTLLLFLWQWIVRVPKWKIFKWTRSTKLNLFIDVYQVPYNHKYRFWTGLLLLVRVVIYIAASLTVSSNPQTLLLTTIILVGSLILIKGVIGVRVHKNAVVDIVDTVLYFNHLALAAFSLYDFKTNIKKQSAIAYTSTFITFILLIGVIFYHITLLTRKHKSTSPKLQDYPLSQLQSAKAEVTCSVVEPPKTDPDMLQETDGNAKRPPEINGSMSNEYI